MLHGGPISRRESVFSDDGKLLLAPCGQVVKIYAVATGDQCSALEGHTAEVTSVALNPSDASQVYTASLDGSLRLWNYRTGVCERVLAVQEAVCAMVLHADLALAYLAIKWRDGQSGRVITYNLNKGRAGATAIKTRMPGPLAMNPKGVLVATIDRHSLFVWRAGPEISQPLNLHHTKPYTCLALSSDDSILAAGDATGRILIWRDVAAAVPVVARAGANSGKHRAENPPPLTTLHWHAGPVGCLAFSPDNTYLRSGGREAVLVSWQLDSNRPNFLPRLGGPLIGLASCPKDAALLLVRQADNTLRVVNCATNKVDATVLGLRPLPAAAYGPSLAAPATAVQPHTTLLTVPTANATLQVYDVRHHRHVSLMQVVPRNSAGTLDISMPSSHVALTQGAGDLAGDIAGTGNEPHVTHTAYTHDGRCMITVDTRPDAGPFASSETSLKFWDATPGATTRQGAAAPFQLNTLMDDAHRGPVTCIAVHPKQHVVVTAGGGAAANSPAEFKVWERVSVPKRPGGKLASPTCWRCRSVGCYKNLPFTAAAISHDGSLLALAALTTVTLWDLMTSTLVAVLPTPPELLATAQGASAAAAVRELVFCSGTPFLVGSSGSAVVVWDVLRAAVHWAAPVTACSLAADPHSGMIAAAVPMWSSSAAQAAAAAPGAAQSAASVPAKRAAAAAAATTGDASQQDGHTAREPAQAATQAAEAGDENGSTPQPATAAPAPQAACKPQSGGPSCWVVAWHPSSAAPRLAARIPNTAHVQLLFLPALPSASAAQQLSMSSPLLVLTAERAYTVLGAEEEESRQQDLTAPEAGTSAYEAGFGELVPQVEIQHMDVDAEEGVGAQPRWHKLFDAPSHALPPPSVLAEQFLLMLLQEC